MAKQISIIIPVYNRGYCLSRCLDSVLKQTFTDWECILVDDGSSDNSVEVCRQYAEKDSRFQVVEQPQNEGVSVARNRGLDLASGEFIAFIDSDDWIEPVYLEVLYGNIDERTMPVVGIGRETCFGNIMNVDQIRGYISRLDNADGILTFWNGAQFCGPVCRLYHRSIIEKYHIRYTPKISWGEDLIFNCAYYQYIEKVCIVSTRLYHVVRQEVSLTTKAAYNKTFVEACRLIWMSLNELMVNKKINSPELEKIINDSYIKFALAKVTDPFYHKTLYSFKHRFRRVKQHTKEIDHERLKKYIADNKGLCIKHRLFSWNLYLLLWIILECRFLLTPQND